MRYEPALFASPGSAKARLPSVPLPDLRVGPRLLRPTPAFASYWHLAAERQRVFFKRVAGEPGPWTDDPVLAEHRFTNAYRASDRVSQYLIENVIYGNSTDDTSTILRVLLFKIFNRVDTWHSIEQTVGAINHLSFDPEAISQTLDKRISNGDRLYSAAYIMPSPRLGDARKHRNHLRLLAHLLADGTFEELRAADSLRDLFDQLAAVDSFGPFLAFQFAIDLNYTSLFGFSEMDFVVAGPGARDGISKCFADVDGVTSEDIIRAVTESADDWFAALNIDFPALWGRPLQLIDCQNLFCEVSKYARVAHPEIAGVSGRTRIKQRYRPSGLPVSVCYPPRWALEYDAAIPVAGTRVEPAA